MKLVTGMILSLLWSPSSNQVAILPFFKHDNSWAAGQKVWRIPPFDIESMVDPVEQGLQILAEAFISASSKYVLLKKWSSQKHIEEDDRDPDGPAHGLSKLFPVAKLHVSE